MPPRIKLTRVLQRVALWGVSSASVLGGGACSPLTSLSPENDGEARDGSAVYPFETEFDIHERADGGLDISLPEADGPLTLEVGVPSPESEILFGSLRPGGDIPFAGVGQSGLTARIGLRVPATDSAASLDRIVHVDMVRVDAPEVRPAQNRLRDFPSSLRCTDGDCILVPLHLQILHLNDLDALDGTIVAVKARVEDPDDPGKYGETYSWGVLTYMR